jgi:hypothetical protein
MLCGVVVIMIQVSCCKCNKKNLCFLFLKTKLTKLNFWIEL